MNTFILPSQIIIIIIIIIDIHKSPQATSAARHQANPLADRPRPENTPSLILDFLLSSERAPPRCTVVLCKTMRFLYISRWPRVRKTRVCFYYPCMIILTCFPCISTRPSCLPYLALILSICLDISCNSKPTLWLIPSVNLQSITRFQIQSP